MYVSDLEQITSIKHFSECSYIVIFPVQKKVHQLQNHYYRNNIVREYRFYFCKGKCPLESKHNNPLLSLQLQKMVYNLDSVFETGFRNGKNILCIKNIWGKQ